MSSWDMFEQFLRTDPTDVGCTEAMKVLHVYVDLTLQDERQATARYAGVTAHLAACGPCGEDFHGLLHAVRGP